MQDDFSNSTDTSGKYDTFRCMDVWEWYPTKKDGMKHKKESTVTCHSDPL